MFSLIFTTLGQGKSVIGEIGEALSAVVGKNNAPIKFSDDFTNSLNNNIAYIKNYKDALDSGMSKTEAIATYLASASAEAKEYAYATNVAEISTENFARSQRAAEIATIAQTKSLTNVRSIIDTYNDGADKLGLTIDEFNNSVKESNSSLGTYLSSLNGTKATMGGYIKSLISAKLGTIALSIATAALNATISFGISIAIQGLITLISDWIHKEEKLIEKSEEAKSAIQSINDNLNANTKTVSDTAERFATLAQNVGALGKLTQNKGTLSTEEYEEFLSLSNQLAGVFPELTKGYDDNGNAILTLSGNVNTIVSSLDSLIDRQKQIANQEIVNQLPDLYGGFAVNVANARAEIEQASKEFDRINNAYNQLSKYNSMTFGFDIGGKYRDENDNIVDDINNVRNLAAALGLAIKEEQILETVNMYGTKQLKGTLLTIEGNIDDNFTSKLEDARKKLQYARQKLESELSSISSYINTWLQGELMYNKIDDPNLQSAVQQMILSFDPSSLPEGVDSDNWEAVSEWIRKNILFAISNIDNEEVANALSKLFNSDNLSLKDLNGFIDLIKNYFGEDSPVYLFIKPKIAEADDAAKLADEVKKKVKDEFDDKVDELSTDDLKIAAQLEVPDGVLLSWNKLCTRIKQAKKELSEAKVPEITVESTIKKLNSLSKGFEQADKIYKDVLDGNGFDVSLIADNKDFKEQFASLDSYEDFLATIVKYPNNIKKCQEAFNDLTTEYIIHSNILKELSDDNKQLVSDYLQTLGVENADTLVSEQLAANKRQLAIEKEKERIETELGVNATYAEIVAKMNEANATGTTAAAYAQLAIEKTATNAETITTLKDIEALENLANSANATTESLKKVARAKALMAEADEYEARKNKLIAEGADPRGISVAATNAYNYARWAQEEIAGLAAEIEYNKVDFGKYKVNYSGGSKTSKELASQAKEAERDKKKHKDVDWIEIRIERLQSAIDKLKNVASGAYNTIGEKLGASFKQIEKINEEINIQKEMYKAYMSYANSVGLSESLAKKVREGAIEISKYDSDTQELIESYKKWYEAALDCSDAVTTLHDDLAALYVDIFNNTKQDFENQISLLEQTQNEYQHELDVIDELSHLGGEKYYKLLQSYEREHIKILGRELDELQKKFDAAMASGEIEKYSDAWYDSKIAINGVKEAIANANIELERYANNLRSANWGRFDFAEERISQLIQEADFLIGLFDEEGLTDDKGQFTDKGWSVAGLHAQNYDVYMLQADDYAKEILRVNKELAKDPANTELIERREELLKLQQDSIKSAADEKSAIIDLVKNGIEKELSSLKKLIDTYNESLDSAKNLHDYQKNVAEKATEIANIQKQMAAYANDSSEEAKSKIQKLEVSLKDAQEDLQETEYDRYISEQKQLLDDLYAEYEETINSRLDEVDGLLSEIFSSVNSNADTIASTIRETAADVGYTLTASMAQVWNGQEKDVISKYGQELSEKLTTLNTVVADIFALAYDKGDANRDGSITVDDARFALRVAQGREKADAKTLRIADLNGDGKISREEAELILKKATGMKAYASGGLADYTGIAKVDGSKQKPELVLNPNDTLNFLSLRDYLRRISAKPVSIENGLDIQHDLITPIMNEMTDVSRIIRDISIPSAMNSMGDINIQIDHVQDYNDFITQLQHDPKAERMIQAMTLGQATGRGSLSKYGVSWK